MMPESVVVACAILFAVIVILATLKEYHRNGFRFPKGWYYERSRWNRFIRQQNLQRNDHFDNWLSRILSYEKFAAKAKRRARYYRKGIGFFTVSDRLVSGEAQDMVDLVIAVKRM